MSGPSFSSRRPPPKSAWGATPPSAFAEEAEEASSRPLQAPVGAASHVEDLAHAPAPGTQAGGIVQLHDGVAAGLSASSSPSAGSSAPAASAGDTDVPSVISSRRAGTHLLSRLGLPSSGRLLSTVRLLAYDPTVEGRVEAFLAECCDASHQGAEPGAADGRGGDSAPVAAAGEGAASRQDLVVSACVGSIVGKYTGWKINLPVALETMLEEQVGLEVKFQETLDATKRPAEADGKPKKHGNREDSVDLSVRDEQQRNFILQRLLQRLLQSERCAYELQPSRREYEVVDRLWGEDGRKTVGAGVHTQQLLRGEEDAEEGLGAGRVLRYRLCTADSSADEEEENGDLRDEAAAYLRAKKREKRHHHAEERVSQEGAEAQTTPLASEARDGEFETAHTSSPDSAPTSSLAGQTGASPSGYQRGNAKRRRNDAKRKIEVVERVPLGSRLIYRPRSDHHIRLTAESEVAKPWASEAAGQTSTAQRLQISPLSREDAETSNSPASPSADAPLAAESEYQSSHEKVIQRSWVTRDIWELRPGGTSGSWASKHGPRWRLIVTEEGEMEDCTTPAPTLLLQDAFQKGGGQTGAAHRLLWDQKGVAGDAPKLSAADTEADGAAGGGGGRAADDVDRYEETKKVYVHLETRGGELQRQLERRKRGQRNAFGALALLVLENAHVLAEWLDQVGGGDFGVGDMANRPLYFPSYMGDVVQAVQKHYNQRKLVSAGRSRIGGLRIHNNQVKRLLINKFVSMGQTVLELACGHGQDLWKYAERCIGKFVGVDLSVTEIREARRRVRERHQSQHLLQQMLHPPAFHVGNLVDRKALGFLRAEKFDVVSCQLAIHYMVQTEQQARDVLSRAAAHLKDGGLLLGSTVCCNALAEHLLELAFVAASEELDVEAEEVRTEDARGRSDDAHGVKAHDTCEFGNEVYSVTFETAVLEQLLKGAPGISDTWLASTREKLKATEGSADPSSWKQYLFAELPMGARTAVGEHLRRRLATDFGVEYHFFLSEAIDAKEFVLPWRSFCAIGASLGLKLVLSMTFPEFLAAAASDPKSERDLKRWLERLNASSRLDKPQFEAFALYKVFAFKKAATHERDGAAPQTAHPSPHPEENGAAAPDGLSPRGEGQETAPSPAGEAPHAASAVNAFLEGVPLKRNKSKKAAQSLAAEEL
ncbi:methyltransferase domain-containing protein [Besnoitia besnoiti]|uniref:mRNA (guanine-N(7))-methyltransferase n=1 Tax=Besnoitia besnoiti TaxID=94643 RepID=A0A2A9M5Y6_BESBE|nr:methyltransferase domain-containing protein [Besnoitia besnoiti]PFH31057.1 methyltransferase domain-containing protein [Besnoitia besnoiti]